MTQFQFDMICKIIQNGAPALANELCGALNDLVVQYSKAVEELQVIHNASEDASEDNKKED